MSREDWILEKREEAERLRGIATNAIVPSRRDFTQFIASQRSEIAVVARLKRRDPLTGGAWPGADLVELARAFDDTDVAAVAVSTAALHGTSIDDLDLVRESLTAPLLRDDFCLDEAQLYDSRLRGADAVRIPVHELETERVDSLCDIAVSLHLTPVLDVGDERDLARAPVRAPHCVGFSCVGSDGFADLAGICRLSERVPRHIVVLALAEVQNADQALELRGAVDGVVVGDALLAAERPDDAVARFLGA